MKLLRIVALIATFALATSVEAQTITPFQATNTIMWPKTDVSWTWSFNTPQTQLLVLERVSAIVRAGPNPYAGMTVSGEVLFMWISTSVGAQVAKHVIPLVRQGSTCRFPLTSVDDCTIHYRVAESVLIYAQPNSQVTVTLGNAAGVGADYAGYVTLSGRLQ